MHMHLIIVQMCDHLSTVLIDCITFYLTTLQHNELVVEPASATAKKVFLLMCSGARTTLRCWWRVWSYGSEPC
jgi:hypothetical protein